MLDKKAILSGPIDLRKTEEVDFLKSLFRTKMVFERKEYGDTGKKFEECLDRTIRLELENKNRNDLEVEDLTEREEIKAISREIDF